MESPIAKFNKKVPTTPTPRKLSKLSVSGKSTQSAQVVLTSSRHYIEHYGQPLPVHVREALTFAEKNTSLSVRLSDNGYAWLVCGRRLLIWKFRPAPKGVKNSLLNQCYELQLVQSDLAHHSELIYVFQPTKTASSHVPACIAISPEGQVRFWPSINHDDISIETNVNLQGQECDSLFSIGELGFILATTTCTICILQPVFEYGKQSIKVQSLKTSSNWFGGIGKLVTSLISSNISSDHSNDIKIVRISGKMVEKDKWNVLILAGHSLQKWEIQAQKPEKLIHEMPLQRIVLDNFYFTLWNHSNTNISECESWILDIYEENDNDLILLVAAVNSHLLPQFYYGLLSIHICESQQAIQTNSFRILKINTFNYFNRQEKSLNENLGYRFLKTSTDCFVFNKKSIFIFEDVEDLEIDCMELGSIDNDVVLNGFIYQNNALFFTKNHGVLSTSSFDSIRLNEINYTNNMETNFGYDKDKPILDNNMYLCEISPEIFNNVSDPVNLFKLSFVYYTRNQMELCNETLSKLVPSNFVFSVDSILDTSVIEVSKSILNDIPAGDSRWSHSKTTPGLGSSMLMQTLKQIGQKQKIHMLLINYLQQKDLWLKLSNVTIRSIQMSTVHVLCEHYEKLVAAKTLKSLQEESPFYKLIENVILVLNTSSLKDEYLSEQDLFYCEVFEIEKGLKKLVELLEQQTRTDLPSISELISLILDTNSILLKVLKEVLQARQNWLKSFSNQKSLTETCSENLPWTATSNEDGIKDHILKQYNIVINYGLQFATNEEQKYQLCDDLMQLIDIILDEERNHCKSTHNIKGSNSNILWKQFESNRYNLINSLVSHKQYDKAMVLAEKYKEFNILIEVCEITDNKTRLNDYMEQFKNEGFSRHTFNWYLKEHKQEKLINQCHNISIIKKDSSMKHELLECLSEHPTLSWVQHVYENKYMESSTDLRKIALLEMSNLKKRKTLLSLAKLSTLVIDDICNATERDYLQKDIESHLEMISYQEDLPSSLLEIFGYDSEKRPYLNPIEIINMLICRENINSNEYDFKKALELLEFVLDPNERIEICLKIWTMALLRDDWNHDSINEPIEILQQKLFFKLIDLYIILGNDPAEFLPQLNILLEGSNELDELKKNNNFQYLIKIGYEYVFEQAAKLKK